MTLRASAHLNYPGDVRRMLGEVKGPNLLGEWFTAVDAGYDPAIDQTRVGFAIGIHKDLSPRSVPHGVPSAPPQSRRSGTVSTSTRGTSGRSDVPSDQP